MSTTVRLRPWQKAALEKFTVDLKADFLAVATPGAGKTTFALTAVRHLLAQRPHARIVVVAPTQHLKLQWAAAAVGFGLQLDPAWSPSAGLADDFHGVVTTYQQVASAADRVAPLAHDGIVVLDEIHHAGDDRAWGDGLRTAFASADRRLSLSGTPFRSDANPIPFVTYEWEEAVPDYEYGYGDALGDGGVVRPAHFPKIKGHMEWIAPDGQFHSHDFDDELDRARANQRLRTALSVEGRWLPTVLADAHRKLSEVRAEQPDAGGLVIAMDVEHAKAIARILRVEHGVKAAVATSDDPEASDKIAAFGDSTEPWIVAVRMVSEGVDIPRLRVGVFATNTTTELFFRQALGRLVRWTKGSRRQRAWMYLPDDVRLRGHAEVVEQQRRHSLAKRARRWEDAERNELLDQLGDEEQISLFAAVSSVVTGSEDHRVFDADSGVEDGELVGAGGFDEPGLEIDLPPLPAAAVRPAAAFGGGSGISVLERKADLRQANADKVAHLVEVTGMGHAEINSRLNRVSGVRRVDAATIDQLTKRLAEAESWLRNL
ncbi:MAG TPA: DEAD/DEAH box helicase [Acidimicrobiales bacterium]|nr:DEAD/DEAH box helicase [Acidimicrobiales bacterium]